MLRLEQYSIHFPKSICVSMSEQLSRVVQTLAYWIYSTQRFRVKWVIRRFSANFRGDLFPYICVTFEEWTIENNRTYHGSSYSDSSKTHLQKNRYAQIVFSITSQSVSLYVKVEQIWENDEPVYRNPPLLLNQKNSQANGEENVFSWLL